MCILNCIYLFIFGCRIWEIFDRAQFSIKTRQSLCSQRPAKPSRLSYQINYFLMNQDFFKLQYYSWCLYLLQHQFYFCLKCIVCFSSLLQRLLGGGGGAKRSSTTGNNQGKEHCGGYSTFLPINLVQRGKLHRNILKSWWKKGVCGIKSRWTGGRQMVSIR